MVLAAYGQQDSLLLLLVYLINQIGVKVTINCGILTGSIGKKNGNL